MSRGNRNRRSQAEEEAGSDSDSDNEGVMPIPDLIQKWVPEDSDSESESESGSAGRPGRYNRNGIQRQIPRQLNIDTDSDASSKHYTNNDDESSSELDSDSDVEFVTKPNNGDTNLDIIQQQQLKIRQLESEVNRLNRALQCPQSIYEISTINESSILYCGLGYAGFDKDRQARVGKDRNETRFLAHYGVRPSTLVPFYTDLMNKYPDANIKDFLMTVNWLKEYSVYEVLAGRWRCCEEYVGPTVKKYGRMMQSFKDEKIKLRFGSGRVLVGSLDCVTFTCTEMRLDPSSIWYDQKSNSCGVVSLSLHAMLFMNSFLIFCSSPFSEIRISFFSRRASPSMDQWSISSINT